MKIPRFLFIDEVAKILRADEKTIRRRIASGRIRAIKEGGRVLIRESEVERYINELEQRGASR